MSIRLVLPQPGGAAPAFTTVKACEDWLEALPLTNAATAQGALRSQVDAITRAGLPLPVLFDILEKMRESIAFVQSEAGKKFTQRPLPMADLELAAFQGALGLWRAYGLGYQMCVQSLVDGARDLNKNVAATVCHRALDAQMRVMFDHVRASCQLPGSEWAMLHTLFRGAEGLEVLAEKVKDPIQKETPASTCIAAYTQALLSSVGSSGEWSGKQMQMIMRWLERWAAKISAAPSPPASPVKPPLMVDLNSLRGGYRNETGGSEVRYIDISEIALSLKNRVILLRKGETPAHLGLGDDCTQPGCEQLLINLYQHWCDGRVVRDHARRQGSGEVLLAATLQAVHYYVSGKPFKQPNTQKELTSKQRAEIATFGRIATRDDDEHSHLQGFSMQQWEMRDESLSGMRLVRPREARGARVAPGQLYAVRGADAKAFMLTSVRWVQMLESGEVMAGLRAIPGSPQPIGIRNTGLNASNEKYQQALLLPAVESLKAPDTVILAPGMYKAGRVLEVFAESAWQIKLGDIIERGADFERCTYGGV